MNASVAVIGAGLGGLSAAIHLAEQGLDVKVYEQSETTGGKAGELRQGGFRFDTGPSLLTMPFTVDDLLDSAGISAELRPRFRPLESLCRYVFPDGSAFDAGAGPADLARELARAFGEDPARIHRYLDRCRRIYELTADAFLFRPVAGLLQMIRETPPTNGLRLLAGLPEIGLTGTMHAMHARAFADPRTVQLFDRYATYVGSSPYRTPATYNTIQHVEYGLGGYTVDGGMHALVVSLEAATRACGVHTALGCPVDRIVVRDGRAVGVVARGTEAAHRAVISDVDARTTFCELLSADGVDTPRRLIRAPLSSSAIVFYWGVHGTHPQFGLHNVLFSGDYQREFADIFGRGRTPQDPTVYVHLSCRHNAADAPRGSENWFVMVNAPADRGQDWSEEIARTRRAVLQRIRKALGLDLEPAITIEAVLSPPELHRRTGAYAGSLYGPTSHGALAPFRRQVNRCRQIDGLYFAGGTAHPGGGIPLAVLSGRFAAECLLGDLSRLNR